MNVKGQYCYTEGVDMNWENMNIKKLQTSGILVLLFN